MKRGILVCLLFVTIFLSAQEKTNYYSFDISNFYGTILKHNPDISHLITGHPSGVMFSMNRKTFGVKEWQRLYNAPDYGVSFIYQDLDNEFLGNNYGIYLHYNFYFLKRLLSLKIGQGVAYTTKPYDIDKNFRNVAYGSHLLSSTIAFLTLKKENILGKLGLQAGIGVIHYSNANVRAPNKSTNTLVATIGTNYILDGKFPDYKLKEKGEVLGGQPLGYGFFYRGGINENDVVGSGQFPFHILGGFIDKKLNKKSSIQVGVEAFFSGALQRFIDFRATGEFEDGVTGEEDSKRVGLYLGHELRFNKLSMLTQLGYYVYYPFDFEGQVYNRIGLQYYISKHIFSAITVKSHAAKAEAVEISIGYRL